jgi:hypothetical protein
MSTVEVSSFVSTVEAAGVWRALIYTRLVAQVFDMDDDGSHDEMGRVETSLRQLLMLGTTPVAKQQGLPCMENKKGGKQKQSGSLFVESSGITRYNTFLDYIKGGW